jgi:hypothetical protein
VREDGSFTARYPAEQPVELRIMMHSGAVYAGRCVVTKANRQPAQLAERTAKHVEL